MTAGLDTNIVCYFLDPAFPEHARISGLLRSLSPKFTVAINPTVLHETYHTLVYAQRWVREDASTRLGMLLHHPFIEFHNQTKSISALALNIAGKYELGGRDSLMLANFLSNNVPEVYTHDSELLRIGQVEWRGLTTKIIDPLVEPKHR
jgi:predicted nucleic acid-binding protein